MALAGDPFSGRIFLFRGGESTPLTETHPKRANTVGIDEINE